MESILANSNGISSLLLPKGKYFDTTPEQADHIDDSDESTTVMIIDPEYLTKKFPSIHDNKKIAESPAFAKLEVPTSPKKGRHRKKKKTESALESADIEEEALTNHDPATSTPPVDNQPPGNA